MTKESFFKLIDMLRSSVPPHVRAEMEVEIAIVGLTGAGKTSTCNKLLGANWAVSHTEATTRKTQRKELLHDDQNGASGTGVFLTDFPGIGETLSRDLEYLNLYFQELRNFDAIIWVHAANERHLSSLQSTFLSLTKELPQFPQKIILGLNKSDLVEPIQWGDNGVNLPGVEQEENIHRRVIDVISKMRQENISFFDDKNVIPFSAKNDWRMWDLFEAVVRKLNGPKAMALNRFSKPANWQPKLQET